MTQISNAMSTPPASVAPDASLEEAARHMADARVGALPVVEDDHVVGLVTDRDLVIRAMASGLAPDRPVRTVMSSDPVTVDAGTAVPAAQHAMRSIGARHLPVTDDGRLVGMVSFDDLFCYLTSQQVELADVVDAARQARDPFRTEA
ncbi:CBS domain-containing protein [Streptomyces ovatisporus]|uniref:CBS domain-containing protein n=1 Tax=Streptomyces ovatisporus TaxID=1128682 RepID=A0ABV9A740_9ACTN